VCTESVIVEKRKVIMSELHVIMSKFLRFSCDADNEITKVTRFDNLVKLNTLGATHFSFAKLVDLPLKN
jgi:hypothetical protein